MSNPAIFAAIWALCGFVSYGMGVAYIQREFPNIAADHAVADRVFHACMAAAFGPVNLIVAVFMTRLGKHGWML